MTNKTLFRSIIVVSVFCLGQLAQAADSFGAIAYSLSTGKYAISTQQPSFAAAYADAENKCGVSDCFVRAGIEDGCIAFAADAQYEGLGFAGEPTLDQASQEALSSCQRPWQNQCQVVCSFCATDSEDACSR